MNRRQYLELVVLLLGTAIFCIAAVIAWTALLIPVMAFPSIVRSFTTDNMARFTIGRVMRANGRPRKLPNRYLVCWHGSLPPPVPAWYY